MPNRGKHCSRCSVVNPEIPSELFLPKHFLCLKERIFRNTDVLFNNPSNCSSDVDQKGNRGGSPGKWGCASHLPGWNEPRWPPSEFAKRSTSHSLSIGTLLPSTFSPLEVRCSELVVSQQLPVGQVVWWRCSERDLPRRAAVAELNLKNLFSKQLQKCSLTPPLMSTP